MARLAADLVDRRGRFLADFSALLVRASADLCGLPLTVLYTPSLEGTPERLMTLLRAHRDRDLAVGTTLSGPHRDGVELLVQDRPLRSTASFGQARLAAVACRLAQALWFERELREPPVLLLDDVTAGLDRRNRDRFRAFHAEAFGRFQTLEALPSDPSDPPPPSAAVLELGGRP